jgi:hypothetical protein
MKKFWIVLLATALVAGFAMSASAADVKFGGSYYVGGMYADKPSLNADQSTTPGVAGPQAFYYQRLRVETTFKVAEGLSLVTRFDALERRWGDNRWMGTEDTYNRLGNVGVQIQENIEFERAYLDFTTKIGRFNIGYQNFIAFGTDFVNSNITRAGIKYFVPVGPVLVIAAIEKGAGGDSNVGTNNGTAADADNQIYDLGAVYKFGAGDAGVIYQKGINKTTRPAANRYSDLNIFMAYARAKFGPVFVEAEGVMGIGDLRKFDSTAVGQTNVSGAAYGFYLHGKGDFGPAYVGGRFAYMSGDDRTTTDKVEGSLMTALKGGDAFNPTLIMWNTEYTKWAGDIVGNTAAGINPFTGAPGGQNTYFDNAWFYQVYGGFKPTAKADIMMSLSYAYADKKPYVGATPFLGDVYGTEIDLVGTYKIFDNLQYMMGAAYLFTGDLFKGINPNYRVNDNFLLMHKLTLTF